MTLSVDAVVYFRVTDPVKAVVNVENYLGAVSQVARTSLRSVIGRADLDTMLSDREQVNAELRAVIDTPTEDWGVSVDRVEIKDIALPEGMRRSMSRQAEAERDRRARVIAADGEFQASARLADAARVMADTPGAMQLRLLQTVSDVAGTRTARWSCRSPWSCSASSIRAAGRTLSRRPESVLTSARASKPQSKPPPQSYPR